MVELSIKNRVYKIQDFGISVQNFKPFKDFFN
jgi:hypothetical protein